MKSGAVVYVKDLLRMQAFYQATFRMRPVDEADDFCVLETEALVLSLVALPDRKAAQIVLSTHRRAERTFPSSPHLPSIASKAYEP
jgi:catechol-2,3-dioxygenase